MLIPVHREQTGQQVGVCLSVCPWRAAQSKLIYNPVLQTGMCPAALSTDSYGGKIKSSAN